ncbi:MAG: hypothetical protein GOVbin1807_18 [Prokaryotic dsDNA virus sp.]|nr:MAG: hypothetical protein GOVbin1807_18 [Prokaryotic dsDNA virus sp.]
MFKVGDLVRWHEKLYIVTLIDPRFIRVMSVHDGESTSAFPPNWLTKVETDNFCPLQSSSDSL